MAERLEPEPWMGRRPCLPDMVPVIGKGQLRQTPEVRSLAEYGCLTRMHVVRLLAPTIDGEDHTKDIDFSPTGIRARSAAGYADTSRVITMAPWEGEFDPMEGVILHEARAGMEISSG